MRSSRRAHEGFTLFELVIVVAIIALIAAIAFPQLHEASRRASEDAARPRTIFEFEDENEGTEFNFEVVTEKDGALEIPTFALDRFHRPHGKRTISLTEIDKILAAVETDRGFEIEKENVMVGDGKIVIHLKEGDR